MQFIKWAQAFADVYFLIIFLNEIFLPISNSFPSFEQTWFFWITGVSQHIQHSLQWKFFFGKMVSITKNKNSYKNRELLEKSMRRVKFKEMHNSMLHFSWNEHNESKDGIEKQISLYSFDSSVCVVHCLLPENGNIILWTDFFRTFCKYMKQNWCMIAIFFIINLETFFWNLNATNGIW